MVIAKALTENLAGTLAHNWWVILLRGIVAILFGAMTLAQPGITLTTLVLLFGAFSLVDGVLQSWTAISHRHDRDNWGMLLLGGVIGIGLGLLVWFNPGMTALALLFYIAIWSISIGMLEIVAAIRLRKEIEGEWRLILSGLGSVALGVVLVLRPALGALAMAWLIALYAIVIGVVLVALSFKMRGFAHRLETMTA